MLEQEINTQGQPAFDTGILDINVCLRFKAEKNNPTILPPGEYLMEIEGIRWDHKSNFLETQLKGADENSFGHFETTRNYAKGGGMQFLAMNLNAVGIVSDEFKEVIDQLPQVVGKKIFVKVVETDRPDSVFPYRNHYFKTVSDNESQSQGENLSMQ
jgi:hypothetical protein